MAARAQQMDDYLIRLEKEVWAVWLPVVARAAFALGFVLGTWFGNMRRGTPEEPDAAQSKTLIPETPPLQVLRSGIQSIIESSVEKSKVSV